MELFDYLQIYFPGARVEFVAPEAGRFYTRDFRSYVPEWAQLLLDAGYELDDE